MNDSRVALCLSGLILVLLASFGCGSGNYTPPLTVVTATSNPLVASYNIRHSHAGVTAWVEFGTDTTYGRQTSVMTDSVTVLGGHTLSILVAGMKPQTTYHMRAHADWTGGSFIDQDQTFTTGALPASLAPPGITITRPTPNLSPSPGVELLSLNAPAGTPKPVVDKLYSAASRAMQQSAAVQGKAVDAPPPNPPPVVEAKPAAPAILPTQPMPKVQDLE